MEPWTPQRYAADLPDRPLLYGGPLVAPRGGTTARFNSADLRMLKDVIAVLGSDDDDERTWSGVPHGGEGERRIITSRPRSAGDIIGAVVARTPQALRAALRAAEVEVGGPDTAPELRPGPTWGDDRRTVMKAIESAPLTRTDTLRVGSGPNGAIELPSATATWSHGRLQVISTSQTPQLTAESLARLFGVPSSHVVLTPAMIGGGFGGKEEIILEPLAALLSRKCGGEPVLVELGRSLAQSLYRRHDAQICVTTGFANDGTLLARWIDLEVGCGAYLGHAEHIAHNGLRASLSLYPMRAVGGASTLRIDGTPVRGAFRGYGSPQVTAACEHQIDLIADDLGIDPIDMRRHNLRGRRDSLASRLRDCLDLLSEEIAQRDLVPERVGVALAAHISSTTKSQVVDRAEVYCRLAGDGFELLTGMVDMGQGILRAAVRVASEELTCEPGSIAVASPPTDLAPRDRGAFASRGSYVFLGAVYEACRNFRVELAKQLGVAVNAIKFGRNGAVVDHATTYLWHELPQICVSGEFHAPDNAMAACAQAVELAPGAGGIGWRARAVISVHDSGRIIDPSRAALQVEGGVLQGLGWALYESAQPVDSSILRAGLPTWRDAPLTFASFVDSVNPASPIGARGLGEIPTVPTLGAVANAFYRIVGEPCRDLPLDSLWLHDFAEGQPGPS